MRKILLACFLLKALVCFSQNKTQKPSDTLDISDLYTPASPGFVLMDKAPTYVDKPTTTKAFEADLLNLAQGAALQFTPFWFKNHNNLQAKDYTSRWHPIYETFNVSLATVKSDSNYSIALGVRSQLLRFFNRKAIKQDLILIDSMQNLLGDVSQDILNNDSTALKRDTAAVNALNKKYQKLTLRPVFSVELAGAALATTPSTPYSKSSFGSLNKSGVWLNILYSPFSFPFDFVGVARYTGSGVPSKTSTRYSAFFDAGVGIFYTGSRFSVSGEYLNRYDYSLKKNYDRLAVAANLKINSSLVAVASFGKNFDNVENVFTSLGINFGLSKNSVKVGSPPGQ